MKNKLLLHKYVAALLIVCLLVQDAAFAHGGPRTTSHEPRKKTWSVERGANLFNISSQLGSIEESFEGTNGKKIIFIQDAHDSLEAQENITRLVTRFVKQGVQTVFEEGYAGPVPTDAYFGDIKDSKIKHKVSFYYLDHLKLGGAEYAHINRRSRLAGDPRPEAREHKAANADWQLIGADDLPAYLENVRAFADSEKTREEIEENLRAIFRELANIAKAKFSRSAQSWIRDRLRYENNRLTVSDYIQRTLAPFDLNDQRKWPLLFAVQATSAQKENAEALLRGANPREILNELAAAETKLEARYFQSAEEIQLWHFLRAARRLAKLSELRLNPSDLNQLKTEMSALDTEKLAAWIAKEKSSPVVLSKKWESQIKSALRFYELAAIREQAVEKTLLDWRRETGDKRPTSEMGAGSVPSEARGLTPMVSSHDQNGTAVLVFGGFHKEGITGMLRKYGFSYCVITPKISEPSLKHQKLYREAMLSKGLRPSAAGLAAHAARAPDLFLTIPLSAARTEIRGLAEFATRSEIRALSLPEFSFQAEKRLEEIKRSEARASEKMEDWIHSIENELRKPKPDSAALEKIEAAAHAWVLQLKGLDGADELLSDEYFGADYRKVSTEERQWMRVFLAAAVVILAMDDPDLKQLRKLDDLIGQFNQKYNQSNWGWALVLFMKLALNRFVVEGPKLRTLLKLYGRGTRLPGEYKYKMAAFTLLLLGMHLGHDADPTDGPDLNPSSSLGLAVETLKHPEVLNEIPEPMREGILEALRVGLTHYVVSSWFWWKIGAPKLKKQLIQNRDLIRSVLAEMKSRSAQPAAIFVFGRKRWMNRRFFESDLRKQRPVAAWDEILLHPFKAENWSPFLLFVQARTSFGLPAPNETKQHATDAAYARIMDQLESLSDEPEQRSEARAREKQPSIFSIFHPWHAWYSLAWTVATGKWMFYLDGLRKELAKNKYAAPDWLGWVPDIAITAFALNFLVFFLTGLFVTKGTELRNDHQEKVALCFVFGAFMFVVLGEFLIPPPLNYFDWKDIGAYSIGLAMAITVRDIGLARLAKKIFFKETKSTRSEMREEKNDPLRAGEVLQKIFREGTWQPQELGMLFPDLDDSEKFRLPAFIFEAQLFIKTQNANLWEYLSRLLVVYVGPAGPWLYLYDAATLSVDLFIMSGVFLVLAWRSFSQIASLAQTRILFLKAFKSAHDAIIKERQVTADLTDTGDSSGRSEFRMPQEQGLANLTLAINVMDLGAEIQPDGKIIYKNSFEKLKQLLPVLQGMGIRKIYLYGLAEVSEISKKIHTVPDEGLHFISGGKATVMVETYTVRREEAGENEKIKLDDAHGNIFSIADLRKINPQYASSPSRAEKEFKSLTRLAHSLDIKITADFISWLAPDAINEKNYRQTFYYELSEVKNQEFRDQPDEAKKQAWINQELGRKEDGKLVHGSFFALRITENGAERVIMVKHLTPWGANADQVIPNPFHPDLKTYYKNALERLIDRGVDEVRVDIGHMLLKQNMRGYFEELRSKGMNLEDWLKANSFGLRKNEKFESWFDRQGDMWHEVVDHAKTYAIGHGKRIRFTMETYSPGEKQTLFAQGVNASYNKSILDTYGEIAKGDLRAYKFDDPVKHVFHDRPWALSFLTNFDQLSLAKFGGPSQAGFMLLVALSHLGVPSMIDLRDLMLHHGQIAKIVGGTWDANDSHHHAFAGESDFKMYGGTEALISEVGNAALGKVLKDFQNIHPGKKERYFDILNNEKRERYFSLGWLNEDGDWVIVLLDFWAHDDRLGEKKEFVKVGMPPSTPETHFKYQDYDAVDSEGRSLAWGRWLGEGGDPEVVSVHFDEAEKMAPYKIIKLKRKKEAPHLPAPAAVELTRETMLRHPFPEARLRELEKILSESAYADLREDAIFFALMDEDFFVRAYAANILADKVTNYKYESQPEAWIKHFINPLMSLDALNEKRIPGLLHFDPRRAARNKRNALLYAFARLREKNGSDRPVYRRTVTALFQNTLETQAREWQSENESKVTKILAEEGLKMGVGTAEPLNLAELLRLIYLRHLQKLKVLEKNEKDKFHWVTTALQKMVPPKSAAGKVIFSPARSEMRTLREQILENDFLREKFTDEQLVLSKPLSDHKNHGQIYPGRKQADGSQLFIKINPHAPGDDQYDSANKHLLREAKTLVELNQKGVAGIPKLIQIGITAGGQIWLRMAGIPDAQMFITDAWDSLDIEDQLELLAQMADIIASVHVQGFLHMDLKPKNFLFARGSTGKPQAMLIDFGSAAKLGEYIRHHGSELFAPPEINEFTPAKTPFDVFSFGRTLESVFGIFAKQHLTEYFKKNATEKNFSYLEKYGLGLLIEGMVLKEPSKRLPKTFFEVALILRDIRGRLLNEKPLPFWFRKKIEIDQWLKGKGYRDFDRVIAYPFAISRSEMRTQNKKDEAVRRSAILRAFKEGKMDGRQWPSEARLILDLFLRGRFSGRVAKEILEKFSTRTPRPEGLTTLLLSAQVALEKNLDAKWIPVLVAINHFPRSGKDVRARIKEYEKNIYPKAAPKKLKEAAETVYDRSRAPESIAEKGLIAGLSHSTEGLHAVLAFDETMRQLSGEPRPAMVDVLLGLDQLKSRRGGLSEEVKFLSGWLLLPKNEMRQRLVLWKTAEMMEVTGLEYLLIDDFLRRGAKSQQIKAYVYLFQAVTPAADESQAHAYRAWITGVLHEVSTVYHDRFAKHFKFRETTAATWPEAARKKMQRAAAYLWNEIESLPPLPPNGEYRQQIEDLKQLLILAANLGASSYVWRMIDALSPWKHFSVLSAFAYMFDDDGLLDKATARKAVHDFFDGYGKRRAEQADAFLDRVKKLDVLQGGSVKSIANYFKKNDSPLLDEGETRRWLELIKLLYEGEGSLSKQKTPARWKAKATKFTHEVTQKFKIDMAPYYSGLSGVIKYTIYEDGERLALTIKIKLPNHPGRPLVLLMAANTEVMFNEWSLLAALYLDLQNNRRPDAFDGDDGDSFARSEMRKEMYGLSREEISRILASHNPAGIKKVVDDMEMAVRQLSALGAHPAARAWIKYLRMMREGKINAGHIFMLKQSELSENAFRPFASNFWKIKLLDAFFNQHPIFFPPFLGGAQRLIGIADFWPGLLPAEMGVEAAKELNGFIVWYLFELHDGQAIQWPVNFPLREIILQSYLRFLSGLSGEVMQNFTQELNEAEFRAIVTQALGGLIASLQDIAKAIKTDLDEKQKLTDLDRGKFVELLESGHYGSALALLRQNEALWKYYFKWMRRLDYGYMNALRLMQQLLRAGWGEEEYVRETESYLHKFIHLIEPRLIRRMLARNILFQFALYQSIRFKLWFDDGVGGYGEIYNDNLQFQYNFLHSREKTIQKIMTRKALKELEDIAARTAKGRYLRLVQELIRARFLQRSEMREPLKAWVEQALDERAVVDPSKRAELLRIFSIMAADYEEAVLDKKFGMAPTTVESYLHAFVKEALGNLDADAKWIEKLAQGARLILKKKLYPHGFVAYPLPAILSALRELKKQPAEADAWFQAVDETLAINPRINPQEILDAAIAAAGDMAIFKRELQMVRSEAREIKLILQGFRQNTEVRVLFKPEDSGDVKAILIKAGFGREKKGALRLADIGEVLLDGINLGKFWDTAGILRNSQNIIVRHKDYEEPQKSKPVSSESPKTILAAVKTEQKGLRIFAKPSSRRPEKITFSLKLPLDDLMTQRLENYAEWFATPEAERAEKPRNQLKFISLVKEIKTETIRIDELATAAAEEEKGLEDEPGKETSYVGSNANVSAKEKAKPVVKEYRTFEITWNAREAGDVDTLKGILYQLGYQSSIIRLRYHLNFEVKPVADTFDPINNGDVLTAVLNSARNRDDDREGDLALESYTQEMLAKLKIKTPEELAALRAEREEELIGKIGLKSAEMEAFISGDFQPDNRNASLLHEVWKKYLDEGMRTAIITYFGLQGNIPATNKIHLAAELKMTATESIGKLSMAAAYLKNAYQDGKLPKAKPVPKIVAVNREDEKSIVPPESPITTKEAKDIKPAPEVLAPADQVSVSEALTAVLETKPAAEVPASAGEQAEASTREREPRPYLTMFKTVCQKFQFQAFSRQELYAEFSNKSKSVIDGRLQSFLTAGLIEKVEQVKTKPRISSSEKAYKLKEFRADQTEALEFALESWTDKYDEKLAKSLIARVFSIQKKEHEILRPGKPKEGDFSHTEGFVAFVEWLWEEWKPWISLKQPVKFAALGARLINSSKWLLPHLMQRLEASGLAAIVSSAAIGIHNWITITNFSGWKKDRVKTALEGYRKHRDFRRLAVEIKNILIQEEQPSVVSPQMILPGFKEVFSPALSGQKSKQMSLRKVMEAAEVVRQENGDGFLVSTKTVAKQLGVAQGVLVRFANDNSIRLSRLHIYTREPGLRGQREKVLQEIKAAADRLRAENPQHQYMPFAEEDLILEMGRFKSMSGFAFEMNFLKIKDLASYGVFKANTNSNDLREWLDRYAEVLFGKKISAEAINEIMTVWTPHKNHIGQSWKKRISPETEKYLAAQQKWIQEKLKRRDKQRAEYIRSLIDEAVNEYHLAQSQPGSPRLRKAKFRLLALDPFHPALRGKKISEVAPKAPKRADMGNKTKKTAPIFKPNPIYETQAKLGVIITSPADIDWENPTEALPIFKEDEELATTTERGYLNLTKILPGASLVITNLGIKGKHKVFIKSGGAENKKYKLVLRIEGVNEEKAFWIGRYRGKSLFGVALGKNLDKETFELLTLEEWNARFFAELLTKPDELSWSQAIEPSGKFEGVDLGALNNSGYGKVWLEKSVEAEIKIGGRRGYSGYTPRLVSITEQDQLLKLGILLTSPDKTKSETVDLYLSDLKATAQGSGLKAATTVTYRKPSAREEAVVNEIKSGETKTKPRSEMREIQKNNPAIMIWPMQKVGTVLISRAELRNLPEENFLALYKTAYTRSELRFLVYGEDSLTDSEDPRAQMLTTIPNGRVRVNFIGGNEPKALMRVPVSERAVIITGRSEARFLTLRKGVSRVAAQGQAAMLALGLLWTVSDTPLSQKNGFLSDPSGRFTEMTRAFLSQLVFASAA